MSWIALGLLLITEILVLTIRFDAGRFLSRPDRASQVLAFMPAFLRIVLCVMAAIAALTLLRLRNRFLQTIRDNGLRSGLWPWLPLHLASFGTLWHSSRLIFEWTPPPDQVAVTVWVAAALATGLFWIAAIVPPQYWLEVISSGRVVLLAGLVLGCLLWAISPLTRLAWESSAAFTFATVEWLLRQFINEVIANPAKLELGTPAFRVTIAPACSGYEGIGLVVLYLSVYLLYFRRELRLPRALWLVPIGATAAWILNVARIATLIVIGHSGSPELALGGFHSQAGWLAFNGVALGLAVTAHRSRFFLRQSGIPARAVHPTTAYLAPLLAVVFSQMLTEVFFNGSPLLYPVRVAMVALVLGYYWRHIRALRSSTSEGITNRLSSGGLWAVMLGVAVFVMWISAAESTGPDPRDALSGQPEWFVPLWVFVRMAGSVLLIPLVEEIAFRGYLLRRLVDSDFQRVSPHQFTGIGVVVSSIVFGLVHSHWLLGLVAGLAYAAAYARRGRLCDAILAHATTNGLITAAALISGNWQLWS